MLNTTPKSLRLQVGIFGRVNVGKSTLMNAVTGQSTSITSPTAGTTTDPVEKSMELSPIGPVTFIDTAGLNDDTSLGFLRTEKSVQIVNRCDIAIIITDYNGWNDYEKKLYQHFSFHNVPVIAIINKIDEKGISQKRYSQITTVIPNPIITSIEKDENFIANLKSRLVENLPEGFFDSQTVLDNLVGYNDTVVLVTPIDKEAPKGRLILPQVQILREVLDKNAKAVVVKETQLQSALETLNQPPKLVITDSQAFRQVAFRLPPEIPLTSFSILLAKLKGDLNIFMDGVNAIKNLNDNDMILIAETCTHHPIEDDIARVKIPKMLQEKTMKRFHFDYVKGHDFPKNLSNYSLIIQCGGCMTNKREILSRLYLANAQNIPITNYGLVIAYCNNVLNRAIQPLVAKV